MDVKIDDRNIKSKKKVLKQLLSFKFTALLQTLKLAWLFYK